MFQSVDAVEKNVCGLTGKNGTKEYCLQGDVLWRGGESFIQQCWQWINLDERTRLLGVKMEISPNKREIKDKGTL